MKLKFIALSVALVATMSVSAQTKKCEDMFVGVGVGAMSVVSAGIDSPTFYANIQLGKYISPAFGLRGVIGGPFATLDKHAGNAFYGDGTIYSAKNKKFGELNIDGILNISNLFAEDLAKFDFYLFAGPTANISREGTKMATDQGSSSVILVTTSDDVKIRLGATAGLGFAYNFTPSFALGLEGRVGVTPSMFGDADAYRKNSGTARLALNAVWNIGGKRGKIARAIAAAGTVGYLSPAAAQALADEAVAKNPQVVEKIVEKEVIKYVDNSVISQVPSSTAIFFAINKANLEAKDKARVKLLAEAIINGDKNAVYEVGGYADKKTGSVATNQKLSEKRAKTVYDALVAAGVPAERLEIKAYGGVGAMFFGNDLLSRTVIVKQK